MALRLDWPSERYVRLYVRDTPDWDALSWPAQALYMQLNRKATRAGYIDLGRLGRRGVGAVLHRSDLWAPVLEPALAELEADGCIRIEGDLLVIDQFVEAQEAVSTSKGRQRKHKWKHRDDEDAPEGEETPEASPDDIASVLANASLPEGNGGVQHGTEGTARKEQHGPPVAGVPKRSPLASSVAPMDADTARRIQEAARTTEDDFAADLEREFDSTPAGKRQARVLAALSDVPVTILFLAEQLKRSPDAIERDLYELKRQGRVEMHRLGEQHVDHWMRRAAKDAA